MQKDRNDKGISIHNNTLAYDVLFESDISLYVYKKVEKISGVMFYIKDNFSNNTDLQKNILKSSREIMSYGSCLIRTDRSNRTYIESLSQSLLELSSLIHLANVSKFITDMNTTVLQKEIKDTITMIKRDLLTSQSIELNREMFTVKNSNSNFHANKINEHNERKVSEHKTVLDNSYRTSNQVESIKDKTKTIYKSISNKGVSRKPRRQNSDRENQVLKIVKDMRSASISDISEKILDCSSKTIQRHLNDLVTRGAIKKEGERRWARYVSV